jgi:hypothetical protein
MKNIRILMIVSGVLTLFVLQLHSVNARNSEDLPVLTVLLFLLIAANVALAINYAKKTDRSPVGWAIGGLLAPYICNTILALLPIKNSVVKKNLEQTALAESASFETVNETVTKENVASSYEELFTSFPATNTVFKIKNGWLKKPIELNVDNLRLFAIVFASNVKWRVTITFASINNYNIDLLPEEDAHSVYKMLEKAITGTHKDCVGISVCLAEYGKEGMQFELTELRSDYPALLAAVYRLRNQRKDLLRQWLAGKAETTITGRFGTTIVLDKDGYHSGNKVTPWSDIGMIRVEGSDLSTIMYMFPKGSINLPIIKS